MGKNKKEMKHKHEKPKFVAAAPSVKEVLAAPAANSHKGTSDRADKK